MNGALSVAAIVAVALLAGCAAAPAGSGVTRAEVAALEVSVTQAERAAGACLAARVGACAVPELRAVMIRDAHAAHDAVRRLQIADALSAPAALEATRAALLLLLAETPAVPAAK